MKLVVDSNVLFTYFWKDSVVESILAKKNVTLFTPEYALEEIRKYAQEIQEKTRLDRQAFEMKLKGLKESVHFIQLETYKQVLVSTIKSIQNQSAEIAEELFKDIDFLALAIYFNHPLWSNDQLLKQQTKVIILNTKEVITLLEK